MRDRAAATLAIVLATTGVAHAGAWLQDKGHWQIITSFETARADAGFDAQGRVDPTIKFDKLYLKSLIEYGWSDRITLYVAPEFVIAKSTPARDAAVVPMRDAAIEMGARMRIFHAFGVASLQTSFKSAGPSDLSNSRGLTSAQIAEIRVLYGTNFHLFRLDGFLDLEAAERWVSRPRPDETVFDAALGLWLGSKTLLMLQSFNVVSGNNAMPPDTAFRTNKLEVSLVRCLSQRWSIQMGAFASPAGRDSLEEQGLETAIWLHL